MNAEKEWLRRLITYPGPFAFAGTAGRRRLPLLSLRLQNQTLGTPT